MALAGAAAFVLLRNYFQREGSPLLWTLLAVRGCTFALTAIVGLVARRRPRSSLTYAGLAAALVPILFAGYIVVALNACWATSCDMSQAVRWGALLRDSKPTLLRRVS